jgi:hypothetical protein
MCEQQCDSPGGQSDRWRRRAQVALAAGMCVMFALSLWGAGETARTARSASEDPDEQFARQVASFRTALPPGGTSSAVRLLLTERENRRFGPLFSPFFELGGGVLIAGEDGSLWARVDYYDGTEGVDFSKFNVLMRSSILIRSIEGNARLQELRSNPNGQPE